MPFEIRYSPRANSEYEEIIDYVFQKFGRVVALKVYLHFEDIIDRISINPLLFPYSNIAKNLRRCVVRGQFNIRVGFIFLAANLQVLKGIKF